MNAESDKIRDSLVDQLSSFEDRLDNKIDDVKMLSEIQAGIGKLLGSDGANEAEIRRVLQDRYDNGALRKETFQLVKSMLDRYVTEQVPTSSSISAQPARVEPKVTVDLGKDQPTGDDPMSTTQVIPDVELGEPDSADDRIQVGSVLRDRFMLQERITGGSMGVVYKAMDRRLAEAGTESAWVALKVLSPKFSQNGQALRALQQEASKGRCLVHPNIVRFIDLDRDDDLYFIVMEWLEGRTLADILDSPDSGSIDTERAFKIVRQIGKALDYAHRCGIVHADVKPGNVMITPNGDAKLFDFGVARVRQKQLDHDPDFDPGVLGLLTPAYSSMQVLTGEKPTPSDDVFSLACLLYRLIAGYRVFGPRNAAEAAEEGMKPQPLEKLSDANWRVLKKALSYSRVTRFESMADFIEALDVEVAESITVDIPAPKRFTEPEERRGPGRALIGLVVFAALSVVVANQMGMLDEFKDQYLNQGSQQIIEEPIIAAPGPALDEPIETDVDLAHIVPADNIPAGNTLVVDDATEDASSAEFPVENLPVDDIQTQVDEIRVDTNVAEAVDVPAIESALEYQALEPAEAIEISEPEVIAVPLVDFSQLPPPTVEILITPGGTSGASANVRLREDRSPVIVDLIRQNVEFPLTLRVEEIGFSGNRSPWSTGQYEYSNNGYLDFPVGQNRARITLTMMSDFLREADQQSTLRIRETDSTNAEIAIINVSLEDDDQRAFERTLPTDTIAFAASQVTVNEKDPAVQLDIIRFNPGNTRLVVAYTLRDITATQGEDYFAPGGFTIEFGPGQRTTRLLIPLVQDSEYEDNEAFSVELSLGQSATSSDIYQRVAVLIRDDDQ